MAIEQYKSCLKVFFNGIKESFKDEPIPSPEDVYQRQQREIFHSYMIDVNDYLLANNVKGKVKIPRWMREAYSLSDTYFGIEIIWGDK